MPVGKNPSISGKPPLPAPRTQPPPSGATSLGRFVAVSPNPNQVTIRQPPTNAPQEQTPINKRHARMILESASPRESLKDLLSELSILDANNTISQKDKALLEAALQQELNQLTPLPQEGAQYSPAQEDATPTSPKSPLKRKAGVRIKSPIEVAIRLGTQLPLEQIKTTASIANYAYDMNIETLHSSGLPEIKTAPKKTIEGITAQLKATYKSIECNPETGQILDKTTGLSAFILHNANTNTLYLVAGGTTSGKHAGNLTERSVKNAAMTAQQWGANARNALLSGDASITDAAQQTSTITTALLGFSKQGQDFPHKPSVELIGHSKGGSDALYAFSQNCTGILAAKRCITFCSAKPSLGIINAIPAEAKPTVTKKTFNILIKGDVVPQLGRGELQGSQTTIPCKAGPLRAHIDFNKNIQETETLEPQKASGNDKTGVTPKRPYPALGTSTLVEPAR